MRDLIEYAGVIAGSVLAVSAVLALVGRWVARRLLLPWLRETLIDPLEATRHQVTPVNNQRSETPTVPDLLHTLSDQVTAMDSTFAGHLSWSAGIVAQLVRRIESLERKGNGNDET